LVLSAKTSPALANSATARKCKIFFISRTPFLSILQNR
jgi:hypothetical protein